MERREDNFRYMKDVLREEQPPQDKELVVVVPTKNEYPRVTKHTIEKIAEANSFAKLRGKNFRVDAVLLSDQSEEGIRETNKGLLHVVKDVVGGDRGKEHLPTIYHLCFDHVMREIFQDHMRSEIPEGKGSNMYIASLSLSKRYSPNNTALVFFDAENEEMRTSHVLALGLPLVYEGSNIRFTKAVFKRYHMVGPERQNGGRVNVTQGVPLVKMLNKKGIIPDIRYPYAGENGIDMGLFQDIWIPKGYGIEMLTLIQLLLRDPESHSNPHLASDDEFCQVDIGLNMDQPLGEGKPIEEIYKKSEEMADQIIRTALCLGGDSIKRYWKTPEGFLSEFEEEQNRSVKIWLRNARKVTGDIDVDVLKKGIYGVMERRLKELYEGRSLNEYMAENFLKPVNHLRMEMNANFYSFVDDLDGHLIEI